ncbi:MAG: alkene reductase [Bacteroidota bacterium]
MSKKKSDLLQPFQSKHLNLKNKIVMAPMTRSRATADHIPTDMMAVYYGQRTGAGLIITEGTAPSPNGVGYPRIPGIYNVEQIATWRKVTDRIHEDGSKVFIQIMHTGRVSHPDNMPAHSQIVAPSAIAPATTKMYTDAKGEQAIPTPKEMTKADIEQAINEFVEAAKNALQAGFDGVEIHAANGYLLDQFINPASNQRTDDYGGTPEKRCKLVLEVVEKVSAAIGREKVGIRISPNGAMNDVGPFDDQAATFAYLTKALNEQGILYIHLVNHEAMGAPALPTAIRKNIRDNFDGILILSGGYDKEKANADLAAEKGDLVAFGRPFLANPDLVKRMEVDAELNNPNPDTMYSPGAEGYIDYPTLSTAEAI